MSHWTTVKTKISNLDSLKSALDRMGFEYTEGQFKITQYNTTSDAQIKLDDAVGFARQKDGTFSMVGDFYHSQNPRLSRFYNDGPEVFSRELDNAYAIEETILRMAEKQFQCVENPDAAIDTNGTVRMVFQRN